MSQLVIPEFEAEAFIAAYELADERDTAPSVLSLFPREQHVGDKVKIAIFTEPVQRVRHTSFGGRSMPVPRGSAREIEYTPSSIKLDDKVTSEELRRFLDSQAVLSPSVAGPQVSESRARALLNTVQQVQNRIATSLRAADNTERKVLCAGALQGAYTYQVADQPNAVTVDLSLTTLTPPSVGWDNAAAVIAEDISAAVMAFKNGNSSGASPTHVFYNPKNMRVNLLKNTQILAYIANNPILSAWQLGLMSGTAGDWLSLDGRVKDLWGLTWVPVDGTYTDLAGSTQDLWHEDYLTLARITGDESDSCSPRWFMSYDPLQNPDAAINIEVKFPEIGEAVKLIFVILFDNGLPGFKRPDLVMNWRVVPA